MSETQKKPLYKRTWFIVIAVLLLLSGIGNAVNGSEPESTQATQPVVTPSETPIEKALLDSPSPKASPSESASADPDSQDNIDYFVYSSTGQFADLNKDIDDAVRRAKADQTIRLLGNILELTFNFGQLEALDPPTAVSKPWATAMDKLEKNIDVASEMATDFTSGKTTLNEVLNSLENVRKQVKSLANVVSKVS